MLADADMWVQPQVWGEVTALVVKAARLIHAEAKPPRTEGTVHVNLTAALSPLDGSHVSEQVVKR